MSNEPKDPFGIFKSHTEIASICLLWKKQGEEFAKTMESMNRSTHAAMALAGTFRAMFEPIPKIYFEIRLVCPYELKMEQEAEEEEREEAQWIAEEEARGRLGFHSHDPESTE